MVVELAHMCIRFDEKYLAFLSVVATDRAATYYNITGYSWKPNLAMLITDRLIMYKDNPTLPQSYAISVGLRKKKTLVPLILSW